MPLPAEIQEALGELVGAAREGLLALSVSLGLTVVHQLMEREVEEVVGPKGKHDPERTAKRHGHEDGSMTLGGRRVPIVEELLAAAEQSDREEDERHGGDRGDEPPAGPRSRDERRQALAWKHRFSAGSCPGLRFK